MDKQTMPGDDELRKIVEIHADDVDIDAIMREIEANVRRRRAEAAARGADVDALATGLYRPEGAVFSAPVYHNLRRASALFDRITVKQYLSPRPIPIIGGLLQRARGALHELVIFYVDMLASKQILVNEALLEALQVLVADLEREAADTAAQLSAVRGEADALRAEVQALRAQLAELQATRHPGA